MVTHPSKEFQELFQEVLLPLSYMRIQNPYFFEEMLMTVHGSLCSLESFAASNFLTCQIDELLNLLGRWGV